MKAARLLQRGSRAACHQCPSPCKAASRAFQPPGGRLQLCAGLAGDVMAQAGPCVLHITSSPQGDARVPLSPAAHPHCQAGREVAQQSLCSG